MQAPPGGPWLYGIVLQLVPGDPRYGCQIWRASDSSAPGVPPASSAYAPIVTVVVPAGGQNYFDGGVTFDGFRRYYVCRQVSMTNAGDLGPFTAATTGSLPRAVQQSLLASFALPAVYPLNRAQPMTDLLFAASARVSDGTQLSTGVKQYDGVTVRVIAKGYLTGTARNGAVVVFPSNFDTVPMVTIRGGLLSQPTSVWSLTGATSGTLAFLSSQAVYDDVSALGLSVSGFTMRARLRQKAVTTLHNEFFSLANRLVDFGDTTVDTTLSAPANTDQYTVGARVNAYGYNTLPGWAGTVTYTVAFDSSTGGGWTERYSQDVLVDLGSSTALASSIVDVVQPITVAGMTSSGQIRVRLKSVAAVGKFAHAATSASFIHGYSSSGGDSTSGVVYNTAADQYASKTPDTDDVMTWTAIQVS